MDQNVRVVQNGFHIVRIRDKIWRQISTIELHPFDHVQGSFDALGFLNGDRAVLPDFFHRIGDDFPYAGIVVRRYGCHLGDVLASFYGLALRAKFCDHCLHAVIYSPLDVHWIGPGRDVSETFLENSFCKNRRCGCAVAGNI